MCTVIGCDHNHGSRSSGVSAEGILSVLGVLAAVAIGGAIFQALWVPIGFALAVGLLLAYDTSRRVTFAVCGALVAGGLWLVRFAWRRLRRRRPGKTVALPREYTATVYVTGSDGRRAVLGTAPVPGTWTNAADVEREVVERWIAKHGHHPAGAIGCHAQPVGGAR